VRLTPAVLAIALSLSARHPALLAPVLDAYGIATHHPLLDFDWAAVVRARGRACGRQRRSRRLRRASPSSPRGLCCSLVRYRGLADDATVRLTPAALAIAPCLSVQRQALLAPLLDVDCAARRGARADARVGANAARAGFGVCCHPLLIADCATPRAPTLPVPACLRC
jgi:hypothetical protein